VIIVSALRFIRLVFVEARQLRAEAFRRYPHLRSE
jgi:hypothetical protein